MTAVITPFAKHDADEILEIRLDNGAGATASILTWGATVRDLVVPAGGGSRRVVLGYESFDGYRENPCYLGVTAGRVANRIGGGGLRLDGARYELPLNEGGRVQLHGGPVGFSRRNWTVVDAGRDFVRLGLISNDGDQGWPGRVAVELTHTLTTAPVALRIEAIATVDRSTFVSLAHHSYFTLGGDVRDHTLFLGADFYTPVDADKIPTGEILTVRGTPFDFTAQRKIGASGVSYDHNFALRAADRGPAARLTAPDGVLEMDLLTTEPAVQLYDGHMLPTIAAPLGGVAHVPWAGVCLEPQRFPDAPNRAHFPSALASPDRPYHQVTEYVFRSLE